MPPKNCKEMKFSLITKDGTVIDLPNEVTDLCMDTDKQDECIQRLSEAISFEASYDALWAFGIDETMIKHWICNNWRKYHGLPMRRKRYGRTV